MTAAGAPERIHDPRRILRLLQQLKVRRATLAAQPLPAPLTASTLVIDVDETHGSVALDELFPSPAQRAVQPGTLLEFTARLDGIALQGRLRVQRIERRGDGEVLVAGVPAEILWIQRRAAYRVPVEGMPAAELLIRGQRYRTKVVDLSVGGFGVEVATDDALAEGSHGTCELNLPGAQVVAGVEVRSAAKALGRLRLGVRYTDLSATQRSALEHVIARLQRSALQKQHARIPERSGRPPPTT